MAKKECDKKQCTKKGHNHKNGTRSKHDNMPIKKSRPKPPKTRSC